MEKTIPTASGRGRHNLLAVDVGGIPKQLANANGVGRFLVKNIAQWCKDEKTIIQEGVVDFQTMLHHPPAINNSVVILSGVKSLDTSLGILGASITLTTVPIPDLTLYNIHTMTMALTAERKHHDIRPPNSATVTYTQKYDSFTRVAHGTLPALVLEKTREFSKAVSRLNLLHVKYDKDLTTVGERRKYIENTLALMERGLAVEANMVQLSLNKGINAEVFFAYRARAQDFSFATILDKYSQSIGDRASKAHKIGLTLGSEAEMVDIANAYAKQVTRDVFALARDPVKFLYNFLRRTCATSSVYNYENGSKVSMEGKLIGGVIFVTKDVMQELAPHVEYGTVHFEKPIHYLHHGALTETNNGTRVVMCIKEHKCEDRNVSTNSVDDVTLSNPLRPTDREQEIFQLTNLGNELLKPNSVDDPKNLPYSDSEEYIVGVIKRTLKDVPYVSYNGHAYPIETVENDIPETNLSSKIRHLCYVRYGWHDRRSDSLHHWAQMMSQGSMPDSDKYSFSLPNVVTNTPGMDAAQVIFGPHEMIYALLNPYFYMGNYHVEKLNSMLSRSKFLQGRSCIWVKDMLRSLLILATNREMLLIKYWNNSNFEGEPIGDGKKALRDLLKLEISPFYDLTCTSSIDNTLPSEEDKFHMSKRKLFGCFPNYVVPTSIRELRGNQLLACLGSNSERTNLAGLIGLAKKLLYQSLQKNVQIVFCDQFDFLYIFGKPNKSLEEFIFDDLVQFKVTNGSKYVDELSRVLRDIVKIYMQTFLKLFLGGSNTKFLENISYLYRGNIAWKILAYCVLPALSGGNMCIRGLKINDDMLKLLNKIEPKKEKGKARKSKEKIDKSKPDEEDSEGEKEEDGIPQKKNIITTNEFELVSVLPPGEKVSKSHEIFTSHVLGDEDSSMLTTTMSHNMYSMVNTSTATDILKVATLMMDFVFTSPYAISKCILSGIHPGFEVDFVKLEETISSEALFVKPLAIDVVMTDGIINVEGENCDKSANFNISCNMKIASNSFSTGSMVAKNIYPAPAIGSLNRTTDAKPKLSIDFFIRSEYINAMGLISALKESEKDTIALDDLKAMKNIFESVTSHEDYYRSNSILTNRTGINNDERYVPIIAPAGRKTPISDIMCLTGIPLCHATCNCTDKSPSEIFFTQISPFISTNPYSSNFGGVNQMLFTPSNTMLCEGFHIETFNYHSSDASVDVTTATIEELFNIDNKLSNKLSAQESWLINNQIKRQQALNGGEDTEITSTPYNGLTDHPILGDDDVPLRFGYSSPYSQYTDININSTLSKEPFTPGGDMKVGFSPMMYAVRSPFTI